MFQDNEDAGDFDRYCGYTPLSQSEEATGHYQMSPDPSSNLHTLQPASQGTYSSPADSEESPSRLHTMQPMQYQHSRDNATNVSSEGSSSSLHNMQPLQYQQLWDPAANFISEGSPSSLHTMQPLEYQHLWDPSSNLRVSEASPYSQHNLQAISEPFSPQMMNKTFDFESSLPEELGKEFTENLDNTSRRPELSYESLSFYTGSSNWDGFFSSNEKDFDDCLKDMYDRDNYNTENGEVEPKKLKNGPLVLGKPDYNGEIDNRDCNKEVNHDNVDDSVRTALNESSKSDDSEEEELIVIDRDTDDNDDISELSQKYEKYCEYPVGKCNTVIVSENDYRSLECSKFLNDIIIDFYLNYIFVHILPVEHQSSVHVFSTLFYKRLLQVPKKKRKSALFEEDSTVPMAEKRHRRVSGWTKDVDLFSKSVLVIPICENSHWYLMMVVGLSGVASHPFILVLDSLGGLRHRAARIIRQYLACEYEAKQMEGNLEFYDIPSVRPAKPKQPNGTDCGVYLLQYAENIFKNIENFLSPNLPSLRNWFSHEEVAKKRSDIAQLIRNLAKEQKSDNDIQFPDIPFTLEKDPEVDDGMELDVEEVKSVDDFISRLEHLTDQNFLKNSEIPKKIVGSEIKKTSTITKRVVRKKIEKMICSGDSKAAALSTSASKASPAAPSTSASRGLPLPEKNPITQTESEYSSSNYCKSYSKGFKIPRIKSSDSTTKQTETLSKETGQAHIQTLPTIDDAMSGTDLIIEKLIADEPKFHAVYGSSKPKIGAVTGSFKSTTYSVAGSSKSTSCPVYGDRCESAYHRHPKVKNQSRKSRNGANSTGSSLGNDSNGEGSSGDIDGQDLQNCGMKKCNIVDKFLTGASETSDV